MISSDLEELVLNAGGTRKAMLWTETDEYDKLSVYPSPLSET